MPNVSLLQSELDVVNVQLQGLSLKNKFIERDLKDTVDIQQFIYFIVFSWFVKNDIKLYIFLQEEKITKIYEKSTEHNAQLSLLNVRNSVKFI